MIMYVSLITEDTCLHTYQIISRSLFPLRMITLLLEFLCLQEIAWVILITDRQRNQMQLLQSFYNTSLTTHRHHLEN